MADVSKKTAQTGSKAKKTSSKTGKPAGKSLGKSTTPETILLPEGYRPTDDEEFMNPMQLAYFRNKLEIWRAELLNEATETITDLSQENLHRPDQMDRAQIESNAAIDLRTRDRERKLIKKIDQTLQRIEDDDYGFCDSCGVEIGIRRLEARPTATLCIDCKTLAEIKEKQVGS